MAYYVYLLASSHNGVLYVGVTGNLVRRVWQHRNDFLPGFTRDHSIRQLVWYEVHGDVMQVFGGKS